MTTSLHPTCLAQLKRSFATRRVPEGALHGLHSDAICLRAGDVVFATVTRIGQHARLELPSGRRSILNIGDEIVVACGARYAPDQFHAYHPEKFGPANLVAAGGIVGIENSRNSTMKPSTQVRITGRFVDANERPVNLVDYALSRIAHDRLPTIIVVAGTSMNAGKTTTCAALIQGFAKAGMRAGYVKATGTGSGGDLWALNDAGAACACDFTDAGFATTYLADPARLADRALDLAAHAAEKGCDIVVMEIADGLLQQETAAILRNETFRNSISGVVLAAQDSMGALAAHAWLEEAGHRILGVSGAFTQAPLAMREVLQVGGIKSKQISELADGALVQAMLAIKPRVAVSYDAAA